MASTLSPLEWLRKMSDVGGRLWVISRHNGPLASCPLLPSTQTFVAEWHPLCANSRHLWRCDTTLVSASPRHNENVSFPYNGTNGCDAELNLQLEPVGPIPRELPVPGILQKELGLGQALPVRGS